MEGDTIVMGSDGLFDNVFDHEIVSTIGKHSKVAEAGRSSCSKFFISQMKLSCIIF